MRESKEHIKRMKGKNGITLIALVITIIVLLILAGISIQMLTGDNSILKRATEAREQTVIAGEKEQIALAYTADNMSNLADEIKITDKSLQNNLEKNGNKVKVSYSQNASSGDPEINRADYVFEDKDGSMFLVEFLDTHHRYLINADGTVTEPISSYADPTTDWEKINYDKRTDDDGKEYYVVTGLKSGALKSSITTINIAKTYKGVAVKTIGAGAFDGCRNALQVSLPNSITKIESHAFRSCGIKKIDIPDSVTSIEGSGGYGAFQACANLEEVKLGKSITYLGENTFRACSSLLHINIPNSLNSCSYNVFDGCIKLTKAGVGLSEGFELERGITKIPDRVFYNTNLQDIEIPNSVTSIGGGAFLGCKLTEITIPDSVTTIYGSYGNGAFQGCTQLNKVNWGTGITSIGEHTFRGCTSLSYIKIPNTVTNMGQGVFVYCTGLTKAGVGVTEGIDLESGRTSLPSWIFSGSKITEIDIPNTITSIGDSAFNGCTELTEIIIPDSVTYIGGSVGRGAFNGCTNLEKVILSNNITKIQQYVFCNCTNLKTIVYKGSLHKTQESLKSAGITSIGTNAFLGTNITKE